MFKRALLLPAAGKEPFFCGPRQTGKTTLLRQAYPDAYWIDLLKSDAPYTSGTDLAARGASTQIMQQYTGALEQAFEGGAK